MKDEELLAKVKAIHGYLLMASDELRDLGVQLFSDEQRGLGVKLLEELRPTDQHLEKAIEAIEEQIDVMEGDQ